MKPLRRYVPPRVTPWKSYVLNGRSVGVPSGGLWRVLQSGDYRENGRRR